MSPYVKRNSFNRGVVKGGDRREPQAQEQTHSSSSGLLWYVHVLPICRNTHKTSLELPCSLCLHMGKYQWARTNTARQGRTQRQSAWTREHLAVNVPHVRGKALAGRPSQPGGGGVYEGQSRGSATRVAMAPSGTRHTRSLTRLQYKWTGGLWVKLSHGKARGQ